MKHSDPFSIDRGAMDDTFRSAPALGGRSGGELGRRFLLHAGAARFPWLCPHEILVNITKLSPRHDLRLPAKGDL